MQGDNKDDKQWITTAVLAALFTSVFMYLPVIGGVPAFFVVCVGQGIYIGWQDVTKEQSRMGALTFGGSTLLFIPIMGVVFSPSGPGNLWPLAAMMGILPGLVAMWGARFARSRNKG